MRGSLFRAGLRWFEQVGGLRGGRLVGLVGVAAMQILLVAVLLLAAKLFRLIELLIAGDALGLRDVVRGEQEVFLVMVLLRQILRVGPGAAPVRECISIAAAEVRWVLVDRDDCLNDA